MLNFIEYLNENNSINFDDIKKELSKYGDVEECGKIGDEYHFKINNPIDNKMTTTLSIMKLITFDNNLVVSKAHTNEKSFHFILKYKS